MKTDVLDPLHVFGLPQHVAVPLFQRQYIWEEEEQWLPLWQDVARVADVRLADPSSGATHFLGAIVLQAEEAASGKLAVRNVVDGQQRITSLHLLVDAAAAVLEERGHEALASQLGKLTHNDTVFLDSADDALKVRHANDDRAAFDEVMTAEPPVRYDALVHATSRIVRAHRFFDRQVREWLGPDPDQRRANALAVVLQQGLQFVVIDLQLAENSQEIFETLNTRGTPLTAADLIRNLVFQRLSLEGADADRVYKRLWPFESSFWEKTVSVGHTSVSRSSAFLNQWLGARLAEEISPKQTFARFRSYVEHEAKCPMADILRDVRTQADQYEAWTRRSEDPDAKLTVTEMCVYRMRAAGAEILKPLLLWLHDPALAVPPGVIDQVIGVMESWFIRRQLVRLPSAQMGAVVANVIRIHRALPCGEWPDRIASYLASLNVSSTVWPGDDEVRVALRTEAVYQRYPRPRLRLYLEAIENRLRDLAYGQPPLSRNDYPIEHLLPQAWETNWGVDSLQAEIERRAHVHRLGNLTLLTKKLNSAVSNSAWLGEHGKRRMLEKHDALLLMNRQVCDSSGDGWDESHIDARTERMIGDLLAIWPVPEGHAGVATDRLAPDSTWVELRHLVAAGLLPVGTVLSARPGPHGQATALVTADGGLVANGVTYASPSAAGVAVRGGATNGWEFWRLADGRRLSDVRAVYRGEDGETDGPL